MKSEDKGASVRESPEGAKYLSPGRGALGWSAPHPVPRLRAPLSRAGGRGEGEREGTSEPTAHAVGHILSALTGLTESDASTESAGHFATETQRSPQGRNQKQLPRSASE